MQPRIRNAWAKTQAAVRLASTAGRALTDESVVAVTLSARSRYTARMPWELDFERHAPPLVRSLTSRAAALKVLCIEAPFAGPQEPLQPYACDVLGWVHDHSRRSVATLDLTFFRGAHLLTPLPHFSSLRNLRLRSCSLPDLSPLTACPSLCDLTLMDMGSTGTCASADTDATGVSGGPSDYTSLSRCPSLQRLQLTQCSDLVTLDVLVAVAASGLIATPTATTAQRLQQLFVERCSQLTDVSALSRLASLHTFTLHGCPQVQELPAVTSSLTSLTARNCESLRDVCPTLSACAPTLSVLELAFCPRLAELHCLADCTALRSVNLSDTALPGLHTLATLTARSAQALRDVKGLPPFQLLTSLDLNNCLEVSDLAPLAKCTGLERLCLEGGPGHSVLLVLARPTVRGLGSGLATLRVVAEVAAWVR